MKQCPVNRSHVDFDFHYLYCIISNDYYDVNSCKLLTRPYYKEVIKFLTFLLSFSSHFVRYSFSCSRVLFDHITIWLSISVRLASLIHCSHPFLKRLSCINKLFLSLVTILTGLSYDVSLRHTPPMQLLTSCCMSPE